MAVRKRTSVALAAAALIAPLLPFAASPAFAVPPEPPAPRAIADLCANVPATFDPFTDDNGNTFEQNIECLAFSEITQGQSGGNTYGPGGVVRRDQMASFIARLIDKADELDTGDNIAALPAFDGTVDFTDVPSGNVHRQNIDRLAEAGVVSGGPGGRPATQYGPELEVTRAQMASFIRNALNFMTGESIESANDYFLDDENATPHEPRINAVAERGIAVGDGRDTYNPFGSVTRGQMSGFLTRTLALLEAEGDIRPVGTEEPEPEPEPEPGADTAVTDAPDLIGAEIVAPSGTATASTTTVVFTFDEEVTAGGLDEGQFHVYGFDGEQFTADSATRASDDTSSVRAVFPLSGQQAEDLTVATVDAAAVEDSDGNTNPIGDAPLGEGVETTSARTLAPDLVSVGNFRPPTATGTTTTVDFTFDQDAFVVNDAEGQFQLVRADGTDVEGTPVETDDGFSGDGTETIQVEFAGTLTAAQFVRGVVLQGTVSSEEQVSNGLPIPGIPVGGDTVEGEVNPLQVTDGASGGTTTAPDLVSAVVSRGTSTSSAETVTFTFDENVALEDPEAFHVYDRNGEQFDGTEADAADRDGDRTVVIVFEAGQLDAVVGASVDEGAVTSSATGARANQEDEVGLAGMTFAAGETVGPDLLDVTRESASEGITLRFTFDDEATDADAASFFVVSDTGEQTPLEDCTQSETTGEEEVVECTIAADDDPLTPTIDESETFTAAEEAVLATVDDGAVTDDEGDTNPEGAALLEDA